MNAKDIGYSNLQIAIYKQATDDLITAFIDNNREEQEKIMNFLELGDNGRYNVSRETGQQMIVHCWNYYKYLRDIYQRGEPCRIKEGDCRFLKKFPCTHIKLFGKKDTANAYYKFMGVW